MGSLDNDWPFPAPMSEVRKGQIALEIVKAMNHDGSLVDVIGNKKIPLALEEKMEFLEALDSEEPSAQEVLASVAISKHADVPLPSTQPYDLGGIRVCPRCKQTLSIG